MNKLNLSDPEIVRLINKFESKILDICYHQDDFTTSDLQVAIMAQVINILDAGLKLANEG